MTAHEYKYPLIDLAAEYLHMGAAVDECMREIAAEGRFILGPGLEKFEKDFASYLNVRHCIGVGSGTAGLVMALQALGAGPGHQVIIPGFTFKATGLAVLHTGAGAVFADVDPETGCIDPSLIERLITPGTRAIIPVHLYGNPCAADAILKIADKHGIPMVEDACEAHGARINGKAAGTFGKCGVFSFYPSKNLGGYGDGGCIVTNDDNLNEKLRIMRGYGGDDILGFNSRLSSMNGALLSIKLPHLDAWNCRRRQLAALYKEKLKGLPIEFFKTEVGLEEVYYLFVIKVGKREELRKYLLQCGIEARIHFEKPVFEEYDLLRNEKTGMKCINSRYLADSVLSLPLHPFLTEEAVSFITDRIAHFFSISDS